ncbi:MAG TPA: hypothetical protein VFR58_11430 [Flavisolibacter sp.]|nr:hypothetical protein [Flavisolibacter sp.]
MKKNHFILACTMLALFAVSCKKNDVQEELPAATETSVTAPEWKSLSTWAPGGGSVISATSSEAAVDAAVAADGMVLVYAKQGGSAQALPFEEKKNGKSTYWYYEVSEGSVTVNADGYDMEPQAAKDLGFRFFVLSPGQVQALEEKGHTRSSLMDLSYEAAKALLN